MKIAFCTLGCKVNQYETEVMRELLEKNGHTAVEINDNPDVILINTCTVTAESDRKSRNLVNRFRKNNSNAVIIVTGCMTEAFPEKAKALTGADIVFGNTDHKKIPALLEEYLKTKKRIVLIEPHLKDEKFSTPIVNKFSGRTRAFIKIEDGCNRFCSYCEIPYARGRVRSKSLEDIKNEAENLSNNGFSEIVLVGINLSAYGSDFKGINLADAIEMAAKPSGIKRIRLGSLEPDHISDEMLLSLKSQPKFCQNFHLSLQSGCDATLKRMNRHYDSEFYYDLVKRIRKIFPDASITTDVLVGFPGETGEEFKESRDFVTKIGFSKCHVFAYSRRASTPADKMPNQITNKVKAERSKEMIAFAEKAHNKFIENMLNNTYDVLVEKVENGFGSGYTKNYTRMYFNIDESFSGKIIKVYAKKPYLDGILGERKE